MPTYLLPQNLNQSECKWTSIFAFIEIVAKLFVGVMKAQKEGILWHCIKMMVNTNYKPQIYILPIGNKDVIKILKTKERKSAPKAYSVAIESKGCSAVSCPGGVDLISGEAVLF